MAWSGIRGMFKTLSGMVLDGSNPIHPRIGGTGVSADDLDGILLALGCAPSRRPSRMVIADSFGTGFKSIGLPPCTVYSPGAAPVALIDAKGSYVSLTYDYLTSSPCGIVVPGVTQGRFNPRLTTVFRGAFVNGRFRTGLYSADPSAAAALGTIKCAGLINDYQVGDNLVHTENSNGTTSTNTATSFATAANAIQAWRVQLTNNSLCEFFYFDFPTLTWISLGTSTTNLPGILDTLGMYCTTNNYNSAQNRVLSPRLMVLDSVN